MHKNEFHALTWHPEVSKEKQPYSNLPNITIYLQNEQAAYRSITAGELRGNIGRKWKYREGTLASAEDKAQEEEERRTFPNQDDVIQHLFKN